MTTQNFTCPECNEYVTHKKQNLDIHLAAKHDIGVTWYNCDQCDYKAKQNAHLKQHKKTRHATNAPIFKCDLCNFESKYKDGVESHKKRMHENPEDRTLYSCDKCDKQYTRPQALNNHKKTEHAIGITANDWFKCDTCDYKTIYKQQLQIHGLRCAPDVNATVYKCTHCNQYETLVEKDLTMHLKRVHQIGKALKEYMCGVDTTTNGVDTVCEYKTTDIANLKRHKQAIHNIDVQLFSCTECNLQFKQKANLEKHVREKHASEEESRIFKCTVENCKEAYKRKQHLESHLKAAHKDIINVEYFPCPECDLQCIDKTNLKRHVDEVHKNKKRFACDECDHIAKREGQLKIHKSNIHDVNVTWYECDMCPPDAVFKTKENGTLIKHRAYIHNINAQKHCCELCCYESKQLGNLKSHLGKVHDIGEKQCQYCLGNRYSLEKMYDAVLKTDVNICRQCHTKSTGYKTRIEKQVVQVLEKEIEFPMTKANQQVNGDACLKYRPDIMYSTPGVIVYVEIDEHEHQYGNGGYECDEKRMSELFDETSGQQVIWVRYNPHSYKVPSGYTIIKDEPKRRQVLVKTLREIFKTSDAILKELGPLSVHYICYSHDNPLISQNIPHKMIYDSGDFVVE